MSEKWLKKKPSISFRFRETRRKRVIRQKKIGTSGKKKTALESSGTDSGICKRGKRGVKNHVGAIYDLSHYRR